MLKERSGDNKSHEKIKTDNPLLLSSIACVAKA